MCFRQSFLRGAPAIHVRQVVDACAKKTRRQDAVLEAVALVHGAALHRRGADAERPQGTETSATRSKSKLIAKVWTHCFPPLQRPKPKDYTHEALKLLQARIEGGLVHMHRDDWKGKLACRARFWSVGLVV